MKKLNKRSIVLITAIIIVALLTAWIITSAFRGQEITTKNIGVDSREFKESSGETVNKTGKVNVYYKNVDENGNILGDIESPNTIVGNVGDEYTTERKDIESYVQYGDDPFNAYGTFQESDIDVNYLYIKDNSEVEVNSQNQTVTVTVLKNKDPKKDNKKAKVQIRTVDIESGDAIANADYNIEDVNKNQIYDVKYYKEPTTLGSINLKDGSKENYNVKQTAAPDNYLVNNGELNLELSIKYDEATEKYDIDYNKSSDNTIDVELTEDNNIMITYKNKKSQAVQVKGKIVTVDKDGNKINGATYTLNDGDKNLALTEADGESTFTLDINSEKEYEYIAKQTKAPDGYVMYGEKVPIKLTSSADEENSKFKVSVKEEETENYTIKYENDELVVTVKNNKKPEEPKPEPEPEKPDEPSKPTEPEKKDPETKKTSIKIVTIDEAGNVIEEVKYKVVDEDNNEIETSVNEDKSTKITTKDIDSVGTDTYKITQEEVPSGYEKLDKTIELQIVKTIDEKNNKYVYTIKKPSIKNVSVLDDNGDITITVTNNSLIDGRKFDLSIKKHLTKVVINENGKERTRNKKSSDKNIMKIDVPKSKLNKTSLKAYFDIDIENVGEIDGYATKILEDIPKGLSIENSDDWKVENAQVISEKLKDQLIRVGEKYTISVVLDWKLSENNIGLRTNGASILESKNPETDAKDENENNRGEDSILVTVKTGGNTLLILKIIAAIILIAILVILIYKFKQNNKDNTEDEKDLKETNKNEAKKSDDKEEKDEENKKDENK